MVISQFRRILQQFAREARAGRLLVEQREQQSLAELAEQLDQRLALNERFIKSGAEISAGPGGVCPCCGR
jgi:hypothetical protein